MDIRKQLKKEIDPTAKPILDQIRSLEQVIQRKKSTLAELESEAQSLQTQAEGLQQQARIAVETGEDPRPLLSEARKLREQAEEIAALQGNFDADEKELARLKVSLASVVKSHIENSEIMQKNAQNFLEALRACVGAVETWNKATEVIYDDLGLKY